MLLIRNRLEAIGSIDSTNDLVRAEQVALHVRKIVEGVAFAALSAAEIRNAQILRDQRTKDADKLLTFLNARHMLRLPQAQRIEASQDPNIKIKLNGNNGASDVTFQQLKDAFSRASAMVHERHPERLSAQQIASELRLLNEDARLLREWLWLHIMFFSGKGFLVQMGKAGTDSFMGEITQQQAA